MSTVRKETVCGLLLAVLTITSVLGLDAWSQRPQRESTSTELVAKWLRPPPPEVFVSAGETRSLLPALVSVTSVLRYSPQIQADLADGITFNLREWKRQDDGFFQAHLTISARRDLAPGLYSRRVRLMFDLKPIAESVPIEVNVWPALPKAGLNVYYPATWHLEHEPVSDVGPLSVTSERNAYENGGIVKRGAAEIVVTSAIIKASSSLDQFIKSELSDAKIEQWNEDYTLLNGLKGTRVAYLDVFTKTLSCQGLAFYTIQTLKTESRVVKFILTYRAGDVKAQSFIDTFNKVLRATYKIVGQTST